MSELASMAALKITNSQQQQQQSQPQQQQPQHQISSTQQLNSPVSIASSLISSDSSATNQHSSPDISSLDVQTPQNVSPQTPVGSNSGSIINSEDAKSIGDTNQSSSVENVGEKVLSPESDVKCKGSVLDKKSMFEKLELHQSVNNNLSSVTSQLTRSESIYGTKQRPAEEIYKSSGMMDVTSSRDTGN